MYIGKYAIKLKTHFDYWSIGIGGFSWKDINLYGMYIDVLFFRLVVYKPNKKDNPQPNIAGLITPKWWE